MTIIGGTLFLGGLILAASGESYGTTTSNGQTNFHGDGKYAAGILATVTGVGLFIPGVIIWSNGQKQHKRYLENERQKNQQTISLGASGQGLSIQYRF